MAGQQGVSGEVLLGASTAFALVGDSIPTDFRLDSSMLLSIIKAYDLF